MKLRKPQQLFYKIFLILFFLYLPIIYGALGTGPFIKLGIGFHGLNGTDLYIIHGETRYRTVEADSLMIHYKNFALSTGIVRPNFILGWEKSFIPAISFSGGVGLNFSGASWKNREMTNESSNTVETPEINAILKLTYLTIPLDVKFMLPLNSGGFYVAAGPTLSILTSAKFENSAMLYTSDDRDLFNPVDINLSGTFGGEVQLKKLDLLINFRIESGVTNLSKDKQIDLSKFNFTFETGLRWSKKRHHKTQ